MEPFFSAPFFHRLLYTTIIHYYSGQMWGFADRILKFFFGKSAEKMKKASIFLNIEANKKRIDLHLFADNGIFIIISVIRAVVSVI